MRRMDIGLVEAMWRLGRFPPEGLPEVAAAALEAGHDGPSLRALAELREPTRLAVGSLFEGAIREMGREPMGNDEAGIIVARDLARRILSGDLGPREGAERIVRDVWDRCRLERLAVFLRLAEEHDRRPEHREVVEEGIAREARRLLES